MYNDVFTSVSRVLILVIMLPFLQSYFFCLTTGRTPKHLQVAVINDEISLAECQYKNFSTGCFFSDAENVPLSCLYLKFLADRTYEVVSFQLSELMSLLCCTYGFCSVFVAFLIITTGVEKRNHRPKIN